MLLLPLLFGISVIVRTTNRGPMLFKQTRVGRGGKLFCVWKFRSMYADAEARRSALEALNEHDGLLFKIRDDPRITNVGQFLRKYSLDELPQLGNVLRGQMSLVGPRPPLPSEVERYEGHTHRRLLVKPGITGLWQVSGRSNLSRDDTVRLDLQYVESWSLGLDLVVLVKTVRAVGGGPSPVKVSMVQPALLPGAPTSPRPKLNLALGLLVGLAVGVGGAVLRETLDTTVKAPDVAEELVGAPMLGAITYDPEATKKPLVVHVAPSSTRAEAFRQMRTNLQFVDIEHPLRSVVVTSSIPGEGKSTTTCNLAITLAQAGVRVVLIEGDLRRPRVADYMGLEGAVGLTSVLLGRAELTDALQPWGDGTLQVLASMPALPNPSELLGSAGMSHLLRELEDSYDLILIDAPPLLPVTDAAVLGAICSGVLMLVRSNSTRREQVARATATVNAVGATILGTVLNMVPTKGPDAYAYGYGYGYGGRYYNRPSGTGRLARDEVQMGAGAGGGAWTGRRGAQESQGRSAPAAPPVAAPRQWRRTLPSTSRHPSSRRWSRRRPIGRPSPRHRRWRRRRRTATSSRLTSPSARRRRASGPDHRRPVAPQPGRTPGRGPSQALWSPTRRRTGTRCLAPEP